MRIWQKSHFRTLYNDTVFPKKPNHMNIIIIYRLYFWLYALKTYLCLLFFLKNKLPCRYPELLKGLATSYLYKDIFTFHDVRKPEIVEQLLRALALQAGSEVSYHELAQTLRTDQTTVQCYLDLLEKSFVVFRLPAFSRNLRNELTKTRKVFFYDNGIRNAILGNYALLPARTDVGALWENFLVSERLKWLQNQRPYTRHYFWRTTEAREIDYLETFDGQMHAYEFKWNPESRVSFPKTFLNAYPEAQTQIVHPENYLDFLRLPNHNTAFF
jgi:predicted AAA+ superfamily ATPase